MSGFTDLCIECQTDPCMNDQDVAEAILARLGVPKKSFSILAPVVANSVRSFFRGQVRGIEVEFGQRAAAERQHSYQELLRSTFAIPDSVGGFRRVAWGEASIGEHQARIEMLETKRDGIEASIVRHQVAIEELRRTGKQSLGELAGAA